MPTSTTATLGSIHLKINSLGQIILQEETALDEEQLIKLLDDPGKSGTREPHENTYIYAGVLRMFKENYNTLNSAVASYVGAKEIFSEEGAEDEVSDKD